MKLLIRAARQIATHLLALAIRALGATWRIETRGLNPLLGRDEAQIGALWHRDLLTSTYYFRDQGFSAPISRSRDGDLAQQVAARLGYRDDARGSSSRGGTGALRALLTTLRRGHSVAIVTDGPRGPARKSKIGVIALARLSGIPITAVAFSARPALRLSSWDGLCVPLPFARVIAHFAEPLGIDADASDEAATESAHALDARTNALTDALDRELGFPDRGPST